MLRTVQRWLERLAQRLGKPADEPHLPAYRRHALQGGTVVSLLVVVAVVGIAALGFHAAASGRGSVQALPVATATANAAARRPMNQWQVRASLATPVFPILAPSQPQVLYQVDGPTDPLRRSTDDGKTWQSIALPERLASQVNLYVSPRSADTLVLSARYLQPPQDGAHCTEAPSSQPVAAGYDCVAEWVSTDGGAHWTTPRLPLAAPLADLAPAFWSAGPDVLQAQGSSLFGALYCHKPLCSNTGYRIVRSADSGVSWQFADLPIAAGEHMVCDFVPVADTSTLFAVSADISCTTARASAGYASFQLWRSDDAGQHWAQVTTLPPAVGAHLLVEPAPAAAQPVLYGNTLASTDGGLTWAAAPSAGLPAAARPDVLGVRHDGALLVGVISMTGAMGQQVTETIYRWRAGESTWQQVGQPLPSVVKSFAATTDTLGQETLWLTVPLGPFVRGQDGQAPVPASYQVESLFD